MFEKSFDYKSAQLYELGISCYNSFDFNKAADFFKQAEKAGYENLEELYDKLIYCYMHMEKHELTLEIINKLIEINPIKGYQELAMQYSNITPDIPKAIEALKKAIEYENDRQNKAYLYANLAECYENIHDDENARLCYDKYIEIDPETGIMKKGFYLKYIGMYQDALDCYLQLENIDTTGFYYYRDIAECYINLGDIDKVIYYLDKEIENSEYKSYYVKAHFLESINLYEEAIEAYLKDIELIPKEDSDSITIRYNQIAECYNAMNKPELAMEYYDKISNLDNEKGAFLKGNELYALGKYQDAIIELGKAYDYSQNTQSMIFTTNEICQMLYKLSECYKNIGMSDNQKKYLEKLYDIIENDEDTSNSEKASCFAEFEQYEKALEYYEKAEPEWIYPQNTFYSTSWFVNTVLEIYIKLNDTDRALTFCDRVIKSQPAIGYMSKSHIYQNEEKYNEQLECLIKAQNADYENYMDLYYHLSLCNATLGNLEKALAYAEKLIELNIADGNLCKGVALFHMDKKAEALKALLIAQINNCDDPSLSDFINNLRNDLDEAEVQKIIDEINNTEQ